MDHKAKGEEGQVTLKVVAPKKGSCFCPKILGSQLNPQDVDEKEDEIIRVPKLIVTAMKFLTVGREWAQQQISTCP